MGQHIKEYFSQSFNDAPKGHFHQVIALNERPEISWEQVSKLMPNLCKGWYELAHLGAAERLEFVSDFWSAKLPYHPELNNFLLNFFNSLDDIGVFITQQKFDDPYKAHLVYCLKDDTGFFKGALGASEQEILDLKKAFPNIIFPADYLAFLQIHNGFAKTTDCTGVTPSVQLPTSYQSFQGLLEEIGPLATSKGEVIDPKTLIPFYESFGMPFFQCFWSEWYPAQEMGNVYYSGMTHTISETNKINLSENMAFPTFLDWLMFYMERIA